MFLIEYDNNIQQLPVKLDGRSMTTPATTCPRSTMSSRIIACFLLPALGSDLSPGGSCRVRRARHVLRTAEGDQLLALREETDATGKWSGNKVPQRWSCLKEFVILCVGVTRK